jgi:hypothetical protein
MIRLLLPPLSSMTRAVWRLGWQCNFGSRTESKAASSAKKYACCVQYQGLMADHFQSFLICCIHSSRLRKSLPCKLARQVNQFLGYNSSKTDRPRLTLLVGPHAALCKPNQGPAQLRLSLEQAASPLLRQLPSELSPTSRSLFSARPYCLAPPVQPATSREQHPRMRGCA